ncbi:MAG TPA: polyprenyl synthetase family protein [Tenuifilaceae bacterium]|nr:polyprenyl synthetase family protein [Tenuifilaceae bacterium]
MLDQIKSPVNEHMQKFERFFKENMNSDISLLNIITNYIYRRKGKQLRPMLVFLSAGLNGEITQSTYVAAGMIELLHTATLVHDDVVDEAYERRGGFSVNALWRSKVAVLVGDFLLSRGLLISIEHNSMDLLREMSKAVKDMSEGELLQIERSRKMNIDEDAYFEIIRMKTASLLASCCVNGAISAGVPSEKVELMRSFGLKLGLAFQMRDDLFDYQPKGLIGKPTGNDIKEKKLTLPLIYALKQATPEERRSIRKLILKERKKNSTIETVVDFVKKYGGIEYTTNAMLRIQHEALDILKAFPESEYRNSLELFTEYIVNRKV